MKQKIVINARFLTQPITGVQRYGIEISKELKKLDPSIQFLAPRNILYKNIAKELHVKSFGQFKGHLWEQIELPFYLKSIDNPLLINLTNTGPLFYGNKIVTIHDIAFEKYPKTFSRKFRWFYKIFIPRLLKTSKHIITVSNFSRDEISDFYHIDRDKINVIYNAVSDIFYPKEVNSHKNYILAVSSLNYQKNFHALLKAFKNINVKNIQLYLVGGINKNFNNIPFLEKLEEDSNIILKGRVEDDELIRLYSNAICFVYPSLYEGFGLPPLEAQACGCPVIVSKVASLPEVYADSALYCNPYSINDIGQKIEMILKDEQLRDKLRDKGYENIRRFKWKQSAEKLYQILSDISI